MKSELSKKLKAILDEMSIDEVQQVWDEIANLDGMSLGDMKFLLQKRRKTNQAIPLQAIVTLSVNGKTMKTKKYQKLQLETQQLELLNDIREKAGVNVVCCGDCDRVFFHKINQEQEQLQCPDCLLVLEPSDCSDLIY